MPQKKRLVLRPDPEIETIKFYPKETFVFILDFQIFYEVGSVLKAVFPGGEIRYIQVTIPLDTCKINRSMGLGYLKGQNFHWVDFSPNSTLSVCLLWLIPFTRYLKVSLFVFCIFLNFELKKKIKPKIFFGLLVHYLLYSLDISGWSLFIQKPSPQEYWVNRHFLSVCLTTLDDLPPLNLKELTKAYRDSRKTLTPREESDLVKLTKLKENEVLLTQKIRIVYWILQQVALKKISTRFSIKTWATCADLILYYAQSLRLWIP